MRQGYRLLEKLISANLANARETRSLAVHLHISLVTPIIVVAVPPSGTHRRLAGSTLVLFALLCPTLLDPMTPAPKPPTGRFLHLQA